MATYSEEELQAAVAEAVAPLTQKIATLETSHEEAELQTRIDEAKAELAEQIAELTSKLDAATIEAATAKEELASTLAYLDEVKAEEERAAAFDALREERVAQVREAVASFPDDYIESNAARWAQMDEEAFTAALEDYKLVAEKAKSTSKAEGEQLPSETAMNNVADTASEKGSTDGKALMGEVWNLILGGTDPRTV